MKALKICFDKLKVFFGKISALYEKAVVNVWFRVGVIVVFVLLGTGAILLSDVKMAEKYEQPGVINKVTKVDDIVVDTLTAFGRDVYVQGAKMDATLFCSRIGIVDTVVLTPEIDPDFDTTRLGIHVDHISYGRKTTDYVYTVVEREFDYDEVPVSISISGKNVFKQGEMMGPDTIMTLTTDQGLVIDYPFNHNLCEYFSTDNKGSFSTTVSYELNYVTVTTTFEYTVE